MKNWPRCFLSYINFFHLRHTAEFYIVDVTLKNLRLFWGIFTLPATSVWSLTVKVYRFLSEFVILLDFKVIFWKHQTIVISFILQMISNVWDFNWYLRNVHRFNLLWVIWQKYFLTCRSIVCVNTSKVSFRLISSRSEETTFIKTVHTQNEPTGHTKVLKIRQIWLFFKFFISLQQYILFSIDPNSAVKSMIRG